MMPPSLVPEITIGLASILAKGTVLLGLAAGIVWGLRHRAAAYRHAVWTAGLGLVLLLPLAEGLLPGWGVSGPAALSGPSSQVVSAESGAQGASPANRPVPSNLGRQERAAEEDPTRSAEASADDHSSVFGTVGWRTLMHVFVGTWALGVAVVLGGTVIGLLRSSRQVQRATRLGQDEWAAALTWARRKMEVDRPVRLYCSSEVSVPMTAGLVRPTILLPASARQWSRERRRTVLLHELAHVQRGDFVANLVAQCTCALHWVNPLTWYVAGRLRFERERACDDRVLGTGMAPTDYADHLVSVAREARGTGSFQGTLTMAAPSTLKQRVESLLSDAVPTGTPSRAQAALLALPLLAATLVLGAARPVASDASGGGSTTAASLPVRTDTTACDPARTSLPTEDRFRAACERRMYRLPALDALALRSGEYGPVVVEAWDSSAVALEATIVTRKPDRPAAEGALSQVRVDVGGDTLRASGPADDAPGWWSVGYRLRVPRATALDLATYSGRIRVRDVAGALRLTSDHGALSVTLPPEAGADLRARTDYGEIDVGFPVTVTGTITEQLNTTVGEGGPAVRLETGDDITIRRADGSGPGSS